MSHETPCQRIGCRRLHSNARFCSRRCSMAFQRSLQTPAERSAIGRAARQVQDADNLQRLLARVKCAVEGEDARILYAWRQGLASRRTRDYKARAKAEAA